MPDFDIDFSMDRSEEGIRYGPGENGREPRPRSSNFGALLSKAPCAT